MTTEITTSQQTGINTIRFNRANKKNAITGGMYTAMTEALQSADQDDAIRVHVILGQPNVFTAGNDIKDFLSSSESDPGLGKPVLQFLRALVTTQKPLVAGVDGLAIGIGTTLLMHCDLVYATDRSFFQTPFTDLGLVPEAASSLIGPKLFGHQRAFALLALGERWDAQAALNAGLINQIIHQTELENHTLQIAYALATKPTSALITTKQLLRSDTQQRLDRINQEAEQFAHHLKTPEAQAIFNAFLTPKKTI